MRIVLKEGVLADVVMLGCIYGDYESTWIYKFAEDEDNEYALVLCCQNEEGVDVIWGKVAMQPKTSIMQEYDIDWVMPEINGYVYDTEYDIPEYAPYIRRLRTFKDWEEDMKYVVNTLGLETY